MGTISKNFSYHEFEASRTAKERRIINVITSAEVRDSIKALVDNLLQPLRDEAGVPLRISSGYRCPELNAKVGGVPTSQHVKGQAADVWCATLTPYDLARIVVEEELEFDQMILYPGFLHLSFDKNKDEQRMELLYNKAYTGKRFKEVKV